MPLVKIVKRRGARAVIEAHGEVLMTPVGSVGIWTNRLSNKIRNSTAAAAPTNSRPYWGHYAGTPRLKESFTVTSAGGFDASAMTIHAAVASRSAYALFVDKGTGQFGGNGPYPAKILPPWRRGDASLYEATWRNTGRKVMIAGQPGQHFFDRGIKFGMLSMGVVPRTIPGDPAALIRGAGTTSIPGASAPDMPLFKLQLEEWRFWRDEAWRSNRYVGRDGGHGTKYAAGVRARKQALEASRTPEAKARRAEDRRVANRYAATLRKRASRARAREKEFKDAEAAKEQASRRAAALAEKMARLEKKRIKKDAFENPAKKPTVAQDRKAFIEAMIAKYGSGNVLVDTVPSRPDRNGRWTVKVWVRKPGSHRAVAVTKAAKAKSV